MERARLRHMRLPDLSALTLSVGCGGNEDGGPYKRQRVNEGYQTLVLKITNEVKRRYSIYHPDKDYIALIKAITEHLESECLVRQKEGGKEITLSVEGFERGNEETTVDHIDTRIANAWFKACETMKDGKTSVDGVRSAFLDDNDELWNTLAKNACKAMWLNGNSQHALDIEVKCYPINSVIEGTGLGIHMDNTMYKHSSHVPDEYNETNAYLTSFCATKGEDGVGSNVSSCGTFFYEGIPVINDLALVESLSGPENEQLRKKMALEVQSATEDVLKEYTDGSLREAGVIITRGAGKWSNKRTILFHRSPRAVDLLDLKTHNADARESMRCVISTHNVSLSTNMDHYINHKCFDFSHETEAGNEHPCVVYVGVNSSHL